MFGDDLARPHAFTLAMIRKSARFAQAVFLDLSVAAAVMLGPQAARAVPSLGQQTGQPCSACHVGAFGPQLKPSGRDFKLYGYVNADGKGKGLPPISLMSETSFTNTEKSRPGDAVPGFGPNNNFSEDEVSIVYAGRITPAIGAFVAAEYDGIARAFKWEDLDVRHAREGSLFGSDHVIGVTLNNNPTVQDLWNSVPAWGFPYASSALAPTPQASTLIEGFSHDVLGVGVYAMVADWVYAEADLYRGLGRGLRRGLGVAASGADSYEGFLSYWRLALQHEFDNHRQHAQLGAFGIIGDVFPRGDRSAGMTDHVVDIAIDANYQWLDEPHVVSAHAVVIDENRDLNASRVLTGTNPSNRLTTFRVDVSYSYDGTWTPTIQYFDTHGTGDPALWTDSTNGSPNSRGYVLELAYVPFGKPGSILPWLNGRLTLQYVGYAKFNGAAADASDNNTVFLNLWLALAPFYEGRED